MGRNTRRFFVAALVVLGAGVAGAQTTPTTTSSPSALPAAAPAVEQIVALAQAVQPGSTAVTAFTVPAGRQLVVTDVVITNPGTSPVCGAAISPSGAAATTSAAATTATAPSTATADTGTITSGGMTTTTTPGGSTVTTPATTSTAAIESGTGTLCVPAQTSLSLSFTTGIEFAAGQSVMLANMPVTATPTATTPGPTSTAAATTAGPLFYHLRGFLVAPGV